MKTAWMWVAVWVAVAGVAAGQTIVGYKGLEIQSPTPTGAAGKRYDGNFKILADRIGPANLTAAGAPSADDDVDEGYYAGSLWYDTVGGVLYWCADNTDGAAVWLDLSTAGGAAAISDLAYATSWDGVTTVAPSKNALYDYLSGLSSVYQAADADLTTWAGVTSSANGRSLVSAADYAAMKSLLDIGEGSVLTGLQRLSGKIRVPAACVTICLDDGGVDGYTVAKPVFDAQGEVGVLSVPSSVVGTEGYLSAAQLLEMEGDGWEIASHAVDGTELDTISIGDAETALANSKTALEALGLTVENLVWPSHAQNAALRAVAREYYRAARGKQDATQGINYPVLETHQLQSVLATNYTDEQLQELVDAAETAGSWVIFYWHTVDGTQAARIDTLIDYVQAAGIQIQTMTETLDGLENFIDLGDGSALSEGGARIAKLYGNMEFAGGGVLSSSASLELESPGFYLDGYGLGSNVFFDVDAYSTYERGVRFLNNGTPRAKMQYKNSTGGLTIECSYGGVYIGGGTGGASTNVVTVTNSSVGLSELIPDYKLDVNGTFGFTPGTDSVPIDNGDVTLDFPTATTLRIRGKNGGTVRNLTLPITDAALTDGQVLKVSSGTPTWATDTDTLGSIGSVANGDIAIYNSGWKRLGKGDDGQVLKMGAALPAWGADNNTEYSAGDGLDLTGTTFSTDLKSGGGLKIDNGELTLTSTHLTGEIGITIDGAGSEIADGVKGFVRIPYACTITGVYLMADQSGSIVVDVWRDTFANYPPTVADTITASAKPTLSSAISGSDTTLTGWTKAVSAGDVIGFNVDSCTTIERLTLQITTTK